MNRGPRRLKDDLDFQWETGCNLGDESVLAEGYDLDRLRAAVISSAPVVGDGVPTTYPRWAWPWWMGGLVGVSTTVAAFWLGTQYPGRVDTSPPSLEVEVPTDRAPLPAPPVGVSAEQSGTAELPDVGVVAPPTVDLVAPRQPAEAPSLVPSAVEHTAPRFAEDVDSTDAVVDMEPEPGAAPRSRLAAELVVYEPADDALEGDDHDAAAQGFMDYLDQFPEGTLRPYAELGLLKALHSSGDASRTEHWAALLQDQPVHREHRDDIRALRAQALVRLGRCDAAIESLEGLPSRVIGPIRRACRGR